MKDKIIGIIMGELLKNNDITLGSISNVMELFNFLKSNSELKKLNLSFNDILDIISILHNKIKNKSGNFLGGLYRNENLKDFCSPVNPHYKKSEDKNDGFGFGLCIDKKLGKDKDTINGNLIKPEYHKYTLCQNDTQTKINLIYTYVLTGVKKGDINIEIQGDHLVVSGKLDSIHPLVELYGGQYYNYSDSINKNYIIDVSKVIAVYNNGVLTVNLPVTKKTEIKNKKIIIS